MIGIAVALTVVAGPLLLWMAGRFRERGHAPEAAAASPWDWRLALASALLYVLAFNLTFLIQELFLVLPKAFTPGLRPTLFHNNHTWDGANPLARLFQGTGALATMVAGVVCASLLSRANGAAATRLFLFWMAFSGVFMALPQVVVGALSEQSDLGMCMAYFGLGVGGKAIAALAALAAIPLAATWLGGLLQARFARPDQLSSARRRKRFMLNAVTLPALLALPAITLFRIPREWIEVLAVPVVVTAAGVVWMQAGAWRATSRPCHGIAEPPSLGWPVGASLCLLAVFQLVLRPGVHFY